LIEQFHQHNIGYLGDSFTGQKTQPTVSEYWRKRRCKSRQESRAAARKPREAEAILFDSEFASNIHCKL